MKLVLLSRNVLQVVQAVIRLVAIQMVHLRCEPVLRGTVEAKLHQAMNKPILPLHANPVVARIISSSPGYCPVRSAATSIAADLPAVWRCNGLPWLCHRTQLQNSMPAMGCNPGSAYCDQKEAKETWTGHEKRRSWQLTNNGRTEATLKLLCGEHVAMHQRKSSQPPDNSSYVSPLSTHSHPNSPTPIPCPGSTTFVTHAIASRVPNST